MAPSAHVRRRLEQVLQNPQCGANVRSALLDVPMRELAAAEGVVAKEAQSPFALGRGQTFERTLLEDDAARLREGLVKANLLTHLEELTVVDLRPSALQGKPSEKLARSRDLFARWLADAESAPRRAHLFLSPGLDAPARDLLGEGVLLPDVLLATPRPERGWLLRLGELKVYPDRGGHTDAAELAGTRRQAGLYLFALQQTLRALAKPELAASPECFLVLSKAGRNQASVHAGEDLTFQARASSRDLERLRGLAAELPAPESLAQPESRLEALAAAPTSYRESCLSFCARAESCHARACTAANPSVLGDGAAKLLGATSLSRAAELAQGAAAQDAREKALGKRLHALRVLAG